MTMGRKDTTQLNYVAFFDRIAGITSSLDDDNVRFECVRFECDTKNAKFKLQK